MASEPSDEPRDVRALCEFLVRRLVDDRESVVVTETVADGARVIVIQVAPDDRGKVIGRQGRIVRALRSVARAGGIRRGDRVLVEIEE
jgi:predicted RNA-binding protein YlqC (UPF0109 family)